ncbi:hypothetical protein WHZ78_07800 [Bradyrhizobium symbiodeficiens]|uniref:hypothetical protein n=1 Tax=Bradyrhizobium symbiodeficiens TaxID=1404367 RepID=UPI0030D09E2F
MIEQLAERRAVDVGSLVEADLDMGWPLTMTRLGLPPVGSADGTKVIGHAMGEQVDYLALLTAIFKPALVAYVEAQVDAVADEAATLPAEAQAEKLAEISGNMLSAARAEATLVWRMQTDGLAVEHRVDADVRAVLGVALQVVPPTASSEPWGMAARAAGVIEIR